MTKRRVDHAINRQGSVNRSRSGPQQDYKRLQRCLVDVAKAVIGGQQPLADAWRESARLHGLRDLRLDPIRGPLLDALHSEIALFGGGQYRERLEQTRQSAAWVAALLDGYLVRLIGLPAVKLAAESLTLDVLIFDDEPEALLRLLLDRGVDYRLEQLNWAVRAGSREQPRTAARIATPWLDARVSVLPKDWERLPLIHQGQAAWTEKYDSSHFEPR